MCNVMTHGSNNCVHGRLIGEWSIERITGRNVLADGREEYEVLWDDGTTGWEPREHVEGGVAFDEFQREHPSAQLVAGAPTVQDEIPFCVVSHKSQFKVNQNQNVHVGEQDHDSDFCSSLDA